ncbi:hypothetical protein N0V86_007846 [Didymella sp. IMI 355093]|nr:hypothetical protein N0V86_007846 [Didymella sp. IMI 355093]
MDQVSPVERSSRKEIAKEPQTDVVSISSQGRPVKNASKTWKPAALRPAVLIFTVLVCWTLIAVLQVFLVRSQRYGGVIFAARISELPISHSFLYLYFPTVIAVIFSMYWAWIDLDAKRMEPYYQLSKQDGALGKDSLLLQYPFDFLPLVPLRAFRDRHWPVFWSSFAVVLVAWGLVPTQAGIFSTKTITRITETPFHRSTAFVPAVEHTSKLSYRVNATVDSQSLIPLDVKAIGEKQAIPDNIFNSTWLEIQMIGTSSGSEVRADVLPTKATPKYLEVLANTELSLTTGPVAGGGFVQPMVGLSVALAHQPLGDLLDWQVLAKSYANAYRLVFARLMRDILDVQGSNDSIVGQNQIRTEAVVLEPVFVYIVEGLLGAVSLATIVLLYLSVARDRNLRSDPSTIASIMSLVADNESLLAEFENLDCCTADAVQEIVAKKRYKLVGEGSQLSLEQIRLTDDDIEDAPQIAPARRDTLSEIAKPIRPTEFSLWVAGLVISLFLTLAIGLVIIFVKARAQGLPLPSSNTIVQNLLENYIPTALATLIEPIWVLFNRILCVLQPIEQLQGCKAKAKDSIDLNYSSLPPQLVIFKALRSKHLVLAAVCTMALLANVLAIAFAGLFLQNTIDMQHAVVLHAPYQTKFVPINGSVGPDASQTFGSLTASGAYQGGTGEDQFLLAESNYTSRTPLPAWVDDSMFYMPFLSEQSSSTSSDQFEADAEALGARLECKALTLGDHFQATLAKPINTVQAIRPQINVTIGDGSTTVVCTNRKETELRPGPIGNGCSNGTLAAELIFQLRPLRVNATLREQQVCMSSVMLGWIRTDLGSCGVVPRPLSGRNSTFVQCQPKLTLGHATIRVDKSGRLQQKARDLIVTDFSESNENASRLFSNDPANLISQSNKYLFPDVATGWHNDSFADDPVNYFVHRVSNTSRFLDPIQSVPAFEDIEEYLQKAYSYLFAIWLGVNKDKLLVPYANEQSSRLRGWKVQPERRLFLSTPMFAISLAILCIYAVVAVFVYTRRPGQYLPRLPTSIASIIALFAASAAVQDMRGTSHLNRKGRSKHLEALDARYGYGSFVGGGDGRVHIGIEKTPFVRVRSKTTWLERKVTSWRKGSAA